MRILLVFCLLISFGLDAQEVSLGPVQKLNKREAISGIFAHDATGFYALRTSYRIGSAGNRIIEKYGNDLKQKFSVELTFDRDYFFDQLFGFQGKIYCLFNHREKSKSKITYYVQEISSSSGKFTGKKKIVETGKMDARNAFGNISKTTSRDTSHIAFFSSDESVPGFYFQGFGIGRNSDGFNEFKVNVYDQNMSEVWKRKIKMPYDNENFNILRYRVDNEGNLYLLIKVMLDDWKQKRRAKKPFKKYQILAYTNNGEIKKTYDIKIKNRFITDITFAIDDNGNIVCSGFNNDSGKSSIGGAFYFVMNKETENFIQEAYKDFDTDELAFFMKERKAKKGKEISSSYALDHLILRDDGGVVLLAEYFDIQTTQTYSTNGGWNTRTNYIYGDIMVLSINPEGQIDWLRKVPKYQNSQVQKYSSYDYAVVEDKIHFVYNRAISRRTDVQLTYIDSEGKLGGKDLFNAKKEKVLLLPAGCTQINNGEMIIYGEWRRQFQFGTVKF